MRATGAAPDLHTDYAAALRLVPNSWVRTGAGLAALAWLAGPLILSDFWVVVLGYAGVAAVGALGLNLLTGYTGQVSLGHAFFLGIGAYVAAQFGGAWDLPLFIWLPACAVVGAAVGAVVGPFALRLRGQYLVVVTLGLVFVGEHIFREWGSVTGGGAGTAVRPQLDLGPVDFGGMSLFGTRFSRQEMLFWLIWGVVGIGVVAAKNLVRTRPGRALQAVRDRDLAAEVIGISLFRYKVGAFAISSAYAAVAGGLYGALQTFVSPTEWSLLLSIQYVAMIIIGGLGTIFGPVLGAVVLTAIPRLLDEISRGRDLPLVSDDAGGPGGIITISNLKQAIFGALIVGFLLFEPRGLAAVWLRFKAYLKTWPFSY
ncbi:MAG TPA: branched-chain amino acid ABC transporter permease [Acidimicrobiales bacterium]